MENTARQITSIADRYRVRESLGSGGFGTVWLAEDQRLERDVAIKVIPRSRTHPTQLHSEALVVAKLNHPGIVTLYEAFGDGQNFYLVSEVVHGPTLATLFEEDRCDDCELIEIGVALCDALAHAHGRGVIHRDIKPQNVIVARSPDHVGARAKLTDFGVASLWGADRSTGTVVGTPAYMAPEQAAGESVTPASDLYSLGLVLYEGLSGIVPDDDRRMRLPALAKVRRDLPGPLCEAIDLTLAPKPAVRPTTTELRDALVATLPREEPEQEVLADSELGPPGRLSFRGLLVRGLLAVGAGGAGALALASSAQPTALAPPTVAGILGGVVLIFGRLGWFLCTLALAGWLLSGSGWLQREMRIAANTLNDLLGAPFDFALAQIAVVGVTCLWVFFFGLFVFRIGDR
jgi:hypothetical protein